jgi:hypothetical protein
MDDREWRYFRFYCNEIAAQITGPFRSSLWNRLVPQAGEMEPFIKHAIIALGALSVSKSHDGVGLAGFATAALERNIHHQYALIQYCQALKGMREAIQAKIHDIRKALIACILVFCFESLQGHQAMASAHATSGVNLLCQWKGDQKEHTRTLPMEEDLYAAFSGLDLQALLFMDSRPATVHQSLKAEMNASIKAMPERFDDLHEAREYWHLIMRRNFHFVTAARSVIQDTPSKTDTSTVPLEQIADLRPGNNTWSIPASASRDIPTPLIEEREEYKRQIQRWRDASLHLFSEYSHDCGSGRGEKAEEAWVITTMLKIHVAMNSILLERAFFPPETAYDSFLSEFRTITDLSALVSPKLISLFSTASSSSAIPSKNTPFHFDIGIIPALALVGNLCRHSPTRSKAISLLLSLEEYKEGVWEARPAGELANWVRRLEEEYCDKEGFVPGNRRASFVGGEIALRERRAKVCCRQKMGYAEKDFVIREGVLSW